MKVAILAGGFGTRLQEETLTKPKPMIEIGGQPLLWHIMKIYAAYGLTDFAVALGYKGDVIKNYFLSHRHMSQDLTVKLGSGEIETHDSSREDWTVQLVSTGTNTLTGGRLRRLSHVLGKETFMFTYGDGLANINIHSLLEFHKKHGRLATVTAVRPPARFGSITFDGDRVARFEEKPQVGEGWINGGFFVLEPEVLSYISGDDVSWEREPMQRLAEEGQLVGYRHEGFWQSIDTLRDMQLMERIWESGNVPWMV